MTPDELIRSKEAEALTSILWPGENLPASGEWAAFPGAMLSPFAREHTAWTQFLLSQSMRRYYDAFVGVHVPLDAEEPMQREVYKWVMNPRRQEPEPLAWPEACDAGPNHRARGVLALNERYHWAALLKERVEPVSSSLVHALRRESLLLAALEGALSARGVIYKATDTYAHFQFLERLRAIGVVVYPATRTPSMTKMLRAVLAEPEVPESFIASYRVMSKVYYRMFAPYRPDPSGIETERGLTEVLVALDKKFGIRNRRARAPRSQAR